MQNKKLIVAGLMIATGLFTVAFAVVERFLPAFFRFAFSPQGKLFGDWFVLSFIPLQILLIILLTNHRRRRSRS